MSSRPAHLHCLDLVRVLTVALVIGVHTVSQQPGGTGLTNGALLTVMHVSREVFFLLTAMTWGFLVSLLFTGQLLKMSYEMIQLTEEQTGEAAPTRPYCCLRKDTMFTTGNEWMVCAV
jgi:hypothetical protein